MKKDLIWWIDNMGKFPKPVDRELPKIELKTDASLSGWGAVRDNIKTGGSWTEEEKSRHINELELLGVLFGLKALCKDIQGQNIKVLTDNSTTVACINKMGSTKVGCNNIT